MVASNATVQFLNLSNVFNKVLLLNGGATVNNSGGSNTFSGPIMLNGSNTVSINSGLLTFSNVISGTGTLVKTSGGGLFLSAGNTYSGGTYVNSGTLLLTNQGSIYNSSPISVASGAALDVLGRPDRTFTLFSTQAMVLAANSTLRGSLVVGSLATVSAGTSIGRITITNGNLTLLGTTCLKLNKAAMTNDFICGPSNILYGGTLSLTNLAGTLTTTNTIKLFSAMSYSGAFSRIQPATPGTGLWWDTTTLATDGTLRVTNTMTLTNVYAVGYSLIANPLEHLVNGVTNNAVNVALTNISCPSCVSGMLTLYFWDPVQQVFSPVLTYYDADDVAPDPAGWYDWSGNYATNTMSPGEGAILGNFANSFGFTFIGAWPPEPPAPGTPIPPPLPLLPGRFYLLSPRPQWGSWTGTYEDIMGAAPTNGSTVLIYHRGGNPSHLGPPDYACYSFCNGGWSPPLGAPLVPVGTSVFVTLRPMLLIQMNPPEQGAITWNAPAGWTLQTASDLAGPWVDLPSAVSPFPVSLSGQSFYRLRGP
jgi:autotransporter-associated beta strand protein